MWIKHDILDIWTIVKAAEFKNTSSFKQKQ